MVARYLYLWFSIFRYSLSRDMEYKTNFIGSLFVDAIYYTVWYYFFEIIYSKTTMLGHFCKKVSNPKLLRLGHFLQNMHQHFSNFDQII